LQPNAALGSDAGEQAEGSSPVPPPTPAAIVAFVAVCTLAVFITEYPADLL